MNCSFHFVVVLKPFHLETEALEFSTFANGSNDADNLEPSEAEDPLVSVVTQGGSYPKEDLIKMFPDVYANTSFKGFKLDLAFNNVKPKDWYFVLDLV